MSNEQFDSVWDAIEDTPAEAASMKLRSALMMALERYIGEYADGGRIAGWDERCQDGMSVGG